MNLKLTTASPVRRIVLKRDASACVACGRAVIDSPFTFWCRLEDPGDLYGSPVAWLTMCVPCSGTPGLEMEARGYRLASGEDPASVPVMLFSSETSGVSAWPTEAGGYVFEAPEARAA